MLVDAERVEIRFGFPDASKAKIILETVIRNTIKYNENQVSTA